MKKIEYKTPNMDVVEMKYQTALLSMSNGGADVTNPDTPERE